MSEVLTAPTRDEIFRILAEVKDPELPMIDVVELGIVRNVSIDDGHVCVDITPTYSGCPAMQVIEREIVTTLASHGLADARIRMVYSPAWTTDWMTQGARDTLREHGIAPPHLVDQSGGGIMELVSIRRAKPATTCPFCGSANTAERSEFGSTACKSIHFCNSCHQPFDHFKPF